MPALRAHMADARSLLRVLVCSHNPLENGGGRGLYKSSPASTPRRLDKNDKIEFVNWGSGKQGPLIGILAGVLPLKFAAVDGR